MFIEQIFLGAAALLMRIRLRETRKQLTFSLSHRVCYLFSDDWLSRNKRHNFIVRKMFKLTAIFTPFFTVAAFGPTSSSITLSVRLFVVAHLTRKRAFVSCTSHGGQQ